MNAALRIQFRAALASLAFLSAIPVARGVELDGDDVGRGAVFFPLTAAALGAIAGLVDWQLGRAASPLLTGSVTAAVAIALTGALHIDGLADFADGFGGRTVEDRLRIMSDHCIGTYGGCALALDLAIRVGAYADVAGRPTAIGIAVAAGALSRAAGPPLAMAFPYARTTPGVGAMLRNMGSRRTVATTVALAIAVTVACVGADTLVAVPLAALCIAIVGRSSRRRIGGITGDTAGAAIEVSEVAILAALACLA